MARRSPHVTFADLAPDAWLRLGLANTMVGHARDHMAILEGRCLPALRSGAR